MSTTRRALGDSYAGGSGQPSPFRPRPSGSPPRGAGRSVPASPAARRPSSAGRHRPGSPGGPRSRRPSHDGRSASFLTSVAGRSFAGLEASALLGSGFRVTPLGAPLATALGGTSGGVATRPIADSAVRALSTELRQTAQRADRSEHTSDMLRSTLKDLRRELHDKARRLDEAQGALDVLGAEAEALRARAATDDAAVRRLQARVDTLESLGRKDGSTTELRRLEQRVESLSARLRDAQEGRDAAARVAETSAEQLKVLRAALELGEQELGDGFDAGAGAAGAGDEPVGRLLFAVARAREDGQALAARVGDAARRLADAERARERAEREEAALRDALARERGERSAVEAALRSLEGQCDAAVARAGAAELRVREMGERMQQLENEFMERDSESKRLRAEAERAREEAGREAARAREEAERGAQRRWGEELERQARGYEEEVRRGEEAARAARARAEEAESRERQAREEAREARAALTRQAAGDAGEAASLREQAEAAREGERRAREREGRLADEVENLHAQVEALRRGGPARAAAAAAAAAAGASPAPGREAELAELVQRLETQLAVKDEQHALREAESRGRLARALGDLRAATEAKLEAESALGQARARVGRLEGEAQGLRADVARQARALESMALSKRALHGAMAAQAKVLRGGVAVPTAPGPAPAAPADPAPAPAAPADPAPAPGLIAQGLAPRDGSYAAGYVERAGYRAAAEEALGERAAGGGLGGPAERAPAYGAVPRGGAPAAVPPYDGRYEPGPPPAGPPRQEPEGLPMRGSGGAFRRGPLAWSVEGSGRGTAAGSAAEDADWPRPEVEGVPSRGPGPLSASVPASPGRAAGFPLRGGPSAVSGLLDDVAGGGVPGVETGAGGPRVSTFSAHGAKPRSPTLQDIASGRVQ